MDAPLDQLSSPSSGTLQPKMPLGKVVLINFGIMLLYLVVTGIPQGQDFGPLLFDAMAIVAQTAGNLFGGLGLLLFSQEKRHIGRAMLLAGLLIGIVGFGACIGKYSVFG